MANPKWSQTRNDVPIKRDTGYRDEGATQSFVETMRRPIEPAATVAAPTPAAVGGSEGGAPIIPAPPAVPIGPDRLHKWAHYVFVGRDHNPGDDPVIPPGYALPKGAGYAASSIADGYAKAQSIAAQDGQRCPLYILGGGGPWSESIVMQNDGVDIVGMGDVEIVGNQLIAAPTLDLLVDNIKFTTPNAKPAWWMQSGPPDFRFGFDAGIRLTRCGFNGPINAFYAQRRFNADHCDFWRNAPVNDFDLFSPCVIEQEFIQTGFTILRGCRFATYLPDGIPDPLSGPRIVAQGYCIRAAARAGVLNADGSLNAGAFYVSNCLSVDDVFRPTVNPSTGTGGYWSGVLLDDCYTYGAALVEGWVLAHLHGRQYGGNPFASEAGPVYCDLYGHDWPGDAGRQYGLVMFDETATHAAVVARLLQDPLQTNPAFPGGACVFLRHWDHLVIDPPAGAAVNNAIGGNLFVFDTAATTPCGHLIGAQPPGPGSQFGVSATTMFHPFNSLV